MCDKADNIPTQALSKFSSVAHVTTANKSECVDNFKRQCGIDVGQILAMVRVGSLSIYACNKLSRSSF